MSTQHVRHWCVIPENCRISDVIIRKIDETGALFDLASRRRLASLGGSI